MVGVGRARMLPSRTLAFSAHVYSLETIKKAAYRFSDVLSIDIVPRIDGVECILNFISDQKDEEHIDRILAAFKNEVLDQDLRAIIARETEATRNAVLAFALSKTGLQTSE
jgi:His-Xaa-Ser system protein HxsD